MPRIDLRAPRSYFGISPKRLVIGLSAFGVITAMYFASIFIGPGPVTFILTVPALTIILITTIAALNDMDRDMCTLRWNLKLFARLFVAAFALAQYLAPFANLYRETAQWPQWRIVYVSWGLALYFLSSQSTSWAKFAFKDQPKTGPRLNRRLEDDYDGLP